VFKNWKTTLAGVLTAIAHISVNGVGWRQLLVSAGIAAIGAVAGDHDQAPTSKPS